MKILLSCILMMSFSLYSQEKSKEVYVVYYFGATDCGPCNTPKNIENIKKIKAELPKKYSGKEFKFVMVTFDEDIEEGIKFVKKYGFWDEISVGKRWQNELVMQHLNTAKLPGLPHIFVDQTFLIKNEPIVKSKTTIVELLGGKQIDQWVADGFPLKMAKVSSNH
ncbi:MAG: hypothetical protein HY089_05800 [Ignavibacteriales bacterium]|nr:hypothetical protein [Ignavibacteriales bacterium]